jgi:predicted GNAT family acetyltransferase
MTDESLFSISNDDHAALDNPIWTALSTRNRQFALGGPLAYRFPAQIGPFAAVERHTAAALHQLREVVALTGPVAMLSLDKMGAPSGLRVTYSEALYQMVATRTIARPTTDVEITNLRSSDVPEMIELARVTRPGPFEIRTRELGDYIGIRMDGRLAAMAGERMHAGHFAEISAVCVHPAYQGRGFAKLLFATLAARLISRDEIPFLHVFTSNAAAIPLYESYGFKIRRHLNVTGLQDADSTT